ncbi:MAG: DoxX family protein [Propionibacteriaceae bacterium]
MTVVRRIARPMLAAVFVYGGIDTLRKPQGRAEAAGDLAKKIARALPVALPTNEVDLVRLDAGLKVVGGLALATNRLPRLAALGLIASMVPTTYAGHALWKVEDPQQAAGQRIHFLKNVGLVGGLLLAAVDTEGKPSVAWRTRHAAETTKKETRRAAKKAKKAQERAAKKLPTS